MSDPAALDMNEPVSIEAPVVGWGAPPEGHPATPVDAVSALKLWSPSEIGWASVLLGYPGALVLAALNWRRMGQIRKAVIHIVAAFVSGWALVFAGVGGLGLILGIAIGYYLFRVQRTDQSSTLVVGRVARRSGGAGLVIALAGTLGIVGSGLVVATYAGVGGVAHRGEVLFATSAASAPCTPGPQVSTFAASDPIFLVAVMRETVQAGAFITFEVEGPGLTVDPRRVDAQPPYDCLSTSESMAGLDAGTYVVRYRYEGQTATPDLASGTFIVTGDLGAPAISAPGPSAVAIASVRPSAIPETSATALTCPDVSAMASSHQAPDIEAALPASVKGRPLARWSVRGQCWLELAFDTPDQIKSLVDAFTTPANPDPIDDARLIYGVAGRSDVANDPPFLVYAAARPTQDDEIGLVITLLFGLAGYHDISTGIDLDTYEEKTIAGKDVYVGTVAMLDQHDHQRGRPYLYQNDEYMFIVVSDDDAWAAEAIGGLP